LVHIIIKKYFFKFVRIRKPIFWRLPVIFLKANAPYFPAYKTHRAIRRTMIFSLGILEKNNDECILILVIRWKKTGLLHILLQESTPFTDLMIWKQIPLSHDKDV
jgi:hypothetical protein